MLRATNNLLMHSCLNNAKCANSVFSLEFVRWRRKPRWLPVAKSKMFRVPERRAQDADERVELMRLHNNYKLQMRTVRHYLRLEEERIKTTSTKDHIVLTPAQEEAEFQHCMQLNEQWNNANAAQRAERLAKERAQRAAQIQQSLERAREHEEMRLQAIEESVRREKALASTFITRDNLDEAIERALANPTDYNFSIDLKDQIYWGRNAAPGNKGGSGSDTPTTPTTSGGGGADGNKTEAPTVEQQQQQEQRRASN